MALRRLRSLASALATLTLILAWGSTTGEAQALDTSQGVPRLDAPGSWDLKKLGSEPFEIGVPGSPPARSLDFFVPKEILEEPAIEFLINLRLSLELAPHSGPGYGVLNVFVNDRAGAQISVEATRNAMGELEARWSTADLFLGPRTTPFQASRAEIDVRNFTPLPSVKAGLNEFSFEYARGGELKLAKALVGDETGLEVSHARPPELRIGADLPEAPAVRGEPFQVRFNLLNVGTVPARKVSVELESSSPKSLSVEGDASRSFERLLGEKEVSFRVQGRKHGDYRLTLSVGSVNANSPQVTIATPIVRGEDPGGGIPWGSIGLLVGLIGLAGWGALRLGAKRES